MEGKSDESKARNPEGSEKEEEAGEVSLGKYEDTSIKVLMNYSNSKYLGSPSLLNGSLKPIREAKDPWSKKIYLSNIQICLNLYSILKSVKLDSKIETQHLALIEQNCILENRS